MKKLSIVRWIIIPALAFFVLAESGSAEDNQPGFKVMKAGEAFVLNELGAVIVADSNDVKVEFIPDPDQRLKDYKDVDIEANDIVLMINGKRVTTVSDLENVYNDLKPGEKIQLGIKRGSARMISSFVKGDEATMPKGQVMMMKVEGNPHEPGGSAKTMKLEGAEGEVSIIGALGLILSAGEKGVTVVGVMPNAEKAFGKSPLMQNDIILQYEDKEIKTPGEVEDIIAALPMGTEGSLTIARGDEKMQVKFVKVPGGPEIMQLKK